MNPNTQLFFRNERRRRNKYRQPSEHDDETHKFFNVVADFGSPVLLKMNYDDGCKKIILNTRNSR
jgi:hypothetical protein